MNGVLISTSKERVNKYSCSKPSESKSKQRAQHLVALPRHCTKFLSGPGVCPRVNTHYFTKSEPVSKIGVSDVARAKRVVM